MEQKFFTNINILKSILYIKCTYDILCFRYKEYTVKLDLSLAKNQIPTYNNMKYFIMNIMMNQQQESESYVIFSAR